MVSVANGTYGPQTIACQQTAPGITFLAASQHGATVSGSTHWALEVDDPSAYLTFDGIDAQSLAVFGEDRCPCVDHVTIEHMTVTRHGGGGAYETVSANNVTNFTMAYVEIGPDCCNADGFDLFGPTVQNVDLDHLYVHDIGETCAAIPAARWANCAASPAPT